MDRWAELRQVLLELERDPRRLLRGYPDPREERLDDWPVTIELSGGAVAVADQLRERFGERLTLRVGFQPYPPDTAPLVWAVRRPYAQTLPASLATAELAAPAVIPSGRTLVTRLVVHNGGSGTLVLDTTGELRGDVVDPHTGELVGRDCMFHEQPFVQFRARAGGSCEVPLRVGTDSVVPRLGYAVPPGPWAITVDLTFAGHEVRYRTPPLPLLVTAGED
jgi:hypothetical protein